MIRYYTREAGVRSLEREVSKICRKVVRAVADRSQPEGCEGGAQGARPPVKAAGAKAAPASGARLCTRSSTLPARTWTGSGRAPVPVRAGRGKGRDRTGQVTGLAWTRSAEILSIEASIVPGRGKLIQPASSVKSCRSRCRRRRCQWCVVAASHWVSIDFHQVGHPCARAEVPHPRTGRAPVSACARRWSRP